MDTDKLIDSLAQNLDEPSPSKHWFSLYWFGWIGCFSLMAILTYVAAALLPADIHLPTAVANVAFLTEAALWFGLAVVSAVICYQSSIPLKLRGSVVVWGYIFVVLLVVFMISEALTSPFLSELRSEAYLSRGPCGIFIFVTGGFALGFMFFIYKKGAPTRLAFTAAWGAASIGALGALLMHLVCTKENSAHVFLWHVIPLVLLVSISGLSGRRFLRW